MIKWKRIYCMSFVTEEIGLQGYFDNGLLGGESKQKRRKKFSFVPLFVKLNTLEDSILGNVLTY